MSAAIGLTTACTTPSDGDAIQVIIPKGASFRTATDSLESAGAISQPFLFRVYAKLSSKDKGVKAGVYLIQPGSNWGKVIATISDVSNSINKVTIPEGFSTAQIAPLIAKHILLPEDSILAAIRDTALMDSLQIPRSNFASLEGYLFPDTYIFPPGTTARQAIAAMVSRFESLWNTEYNSRLTELGLTRHELVSIASIVEKEARIDSERPVIAAVYLNRIKIGMPLQADPTVQYARGQHTSRVLFDDLKIESPYNTYLYPGIPPGPIASPGTASIKATLYPANVSYLFFVARPDGSHQFTNTFAEHTRAIREIRGSSSGR